MTTILDFVNELGTTLTESFNSKVVLELLYKQPGYQADVRDGQFVFSRATLEKIYQEKQK